MANCYRWDSTILTFDNDEYTFDFECIAQLHLAEVYLLGQGETEITASILFLALLDAYGGGELKVNGALEINAIFSALGYGSLDVELMLYIYKKIQCTSNFKTFSACVSKFITLSECKSNFEVTLQELSDFCSNSVEYSNLKDKIKQISEFKYIINK